MSTIETRELPDPVPVLLEIERRLAQAWVEADRSFIDALLAPDWRVTDPSGRILTKQQVLDETFSSGDRRIDSMAVDDLHVRSLGSTAVVTGRTRATGTYRGQSASVVLRFTDVFHFRDGRWMVVASHGTLVAPGD
jgi:ketosteroid isomerase-like protein